MGEDPEPASPPGTGLRVGDLRGFGPLRGEESVIADNVGNFVGGVAIPLVADTLSALMIFTTALVALASQLVLPSWVMRARFYPPRA